MTNNTCENGATCHADSEGVTCECLPGFTGVDCETGIALIYLYDFIYHT